MPDTPTPSAALASYIRQQVEAVREAESAIESSDPEGVHDLRVAMRRLRATLRTYRHLLDTDVTEPIRADLRDFSHELGQARDLEVVHERLEKMLEDEPKGPARAAARLRLSVAHGRDQAEILRTTQHVLASKRYLATRAKLDRFAEAPPTRQAASTSPLPGMLARDLRRIRRRAHAAETAVAPADRQHELHETRKATKQLRYAAEAVVPVLGRDASHLVKRAKVLQTLLGEHHDTVLTRARLRDLAGEDHADDAVVWARMHAEEEAEALRLEDEFWRAWADFSGEDDARAVS